MIMPAFSQLLDKNRYLNIEILAVICLLFSSKYIYKVVSKFSGADPFKIIFLCVTYLLVLWLFSRKKAIFDKIVFLLVFLIPLGSFNIPVIRHYLPVQTVRIYSVVAISMFLLSVLIRTKGKIYSRRAKVTLMCTSGFIIEAILSYWLSDEGIRQPFFSEIRIWASLFGVIAFMFITKISINPGTKDKVVLSLFVIYLIDVLLTLLQQKFGTLASPFATMGIKELGPNIRYGALTRSPGVFYASLINTSFLGIMNIFFFCIYLFRITVNSLSEKFVLVSVLFGFFASIVTLGRTSIYGQLLCLSLIFLRQKKYPRVSFKRLSAPFMVLIVVCIVSVWILRDTQYSGAIDRMFNVGSSVSELSQTEEGRPALILKSLPSIGENLFIGAGPGKGHIESGFFTVLLRYGLFGFILFFLPIIFLLYRNIIKGDIHAESIGMAASWAVFFGLTQFTLTGTFLGIKLLMLFYVLMALSSRREVFGRACS